MYNMYIEFILFWTQRNCNQCSQNRYPISHSITYTFISPNCIWPAAIMVNFLSQINTKSPTVFYNNSNLFSIRLFDVHPDWLFGFCRVCVTFYFTSSTCMDIWGQECYFFLIYVPPSVRQWGPIHYSSYLISDVDPNQLDCISQQNMDFIIYECVNMRAFIYYQLLLHH